MFDMFSTEFLRKHLLLIFVSIYVVLSLVALSSMIAGSKGNPHTRKSHIGVWADWRPNDKPVVYRVLMPAMTSVVLYVIPDVVQEAAVPHLIAFRDSSVGRYFLRVHPKGPAWALTEPFIFMTFIKTLMVAASLGAFVWMLYTLTAAIFPHSRAYALVTPVIALLYIPIPARHYSYTYDMLELFFSCACFYLLFKQRWRVYLLVFLLGTLNKETTLFAAIFYFLWFRNKLPREQYWRLGLAQLCIIIVVKLLLAWYFIDYPGVLTKDLLWNNLYFIRDYKYATFLGMFAAAWVVLYQWQEKPTFLRAGLWMVGANFAAYMMVCTPGEYRDLYWGVPVLAMLAAHTLIRSAGIESMPIFRPLEKSRETI